MMASALPDNGRFVVVIPVYNHGPAVRSVVTAALALGLPLVVVDDGSTDGGCRGLAEMPGVRLVRHVINRGKGAALMTGFRAAAGMADWVITLDADGQHRPEEAPALMAAIGEGFRGVVIGCRTQMLTAGAPWTSRFGRGFSNFWIRAAGGHKVADSQSGFRIYPLPEAMQLGVRARRYQFEVEVLVRARWAGLPVVEAPITVTYGAPGERVSHFRPCVDFLRNSMTFTRLICEHLLGMKWWDVRRAGDASDHFRSRGGAGT